MLAFFFEGTFMARGKFSSGGKYPPGQLPREQLSPVANVGGIIRGAIIQEAIFREVTFRGAIFLCDNYPHGQLPGGNYREAIIQGAIFRGQFSSGAIVYEKGIHYSG